MIEDDRAMRLLHHDHSFARDAWRQTRLVDAKSKASRAERDQGRTRTMSDVTRACTAAEKVQ